MPKKIFLPSILFLRAYVIISTGFIWCICYFYSKLQNNYYIIIHLLIVFLVFLLNDQIFLFWSIYKCYVQVLFFTLVFEHFTFVYFYTFEDCIIISKYFFLKWKKFKISKRLVCVTLVKTQQKHRELYTFLIVCQNGLNGLSKILSDLTKYFWNKIRNVHNR